MQAPVTLVLLVMLTTATGCGGSGSSNGDGEPAPDEGSIVVSHERAFTNLSFETPVALVQAPADTTAWYVVEQTGRILKFANEATTAQTETFLDIRDRVSAGGERGLLGLAFSPDFDTNGRFYVSYTGEGPVSFISRFTVDATGMADRDSEEVLIQFEQPFNNHNGGHLLFGADGFLYAGFGDGGSANDPGNRAQDTSNLFGTIVRLDVSAANGYQIPPDNPFAGEEPCENGAGPRPCPEIYAFGLRNPWRFSFDSLTDELWAADVGQSDFEEIDRIVAGGNYGWPLREGAHCNPNRDDADCESDEFIDPVAEYTHALGQSVTGGFVYRGAALGLDGEYVGGDFVSGVIFSFPTETGDLETLLETETNISSFAEDGDRELYFLDHGQGEIYRLTGELQTD